MAKRGEIRCLFACAACGMRPRPKRRPIRASRESVRRAFAAQLAARFASREQKPGDAPFIRPGRFRQSISTDRAARPATEFTAARLSSTGSGRQFVLVEFGSLSFFPTASVSSTIDKPSLKWLLVNRGRLSSPIRSILGCQF
ncbi:hypothetical protein NL676_007688 [Syzygium grande]|nr:hypothetical protein NL676_007688 [Syzygium grande]